MKKMSFKEFILKDRNHILQRNILITLNKTNTLLREQKLSNQLTKDITKSLYTILVSSPKTFTFDLHQTKLSLIDNLTIKDLVLHFPPSHKNQLFFICSYALIRNNFDLFNNFFKCGYFSTPRFLFGGFSLVHLAMRSSFEIQKVCSGLELHGFYPNPIIFGKIADSKNNYYLPIKFNNYLQMLELKNIFVSKNNTKDKIKDNKKINDCINDAVNDKSYIHSKKKSIFKSKRNFESSQNKSMHSLIKELEKLREVRKSKEIIEFLTEENNIVTKDDERYSDDYKEEETNFFTKIKNFIFNEPGTRKNRNLRNKNVRNLTHTGINNIYNKNMRSNGRNTISNMIVNNTTQDLAQNSKKDLPAQDSPENNNIESIYLNEIARIINNTNIEDINTANKKYINTANVFLMEDFSNNQIVKEYFRREKNRLIFPIDIACINNDFQYLNFFVINFPVCIILSSLGLSLTKDPKIASYLLNYSCFIPKYLFHLHLSLGNIGIIGILLNEININNDLSNTKLGPDNNISNNRNERSIDHTLQNNNITSSDNILSITPDFIRFRNNRSIQDILNSKFILNNINNIYLGSDKNNNSILKIAKDNFLLLNFMNNRIEIFKMIKNSFETESVANKTIQFMINSDNNNFNDNSTFNDSYNLSSDGYLSLKNEVEAMLESIKIRLYMRKQKKSTKEKSGFLLLSNDEPSKKFCTEISLLEDSEFKTEDGNEALRILIESVEEFGIVNTKYKDSILNVDRFKM